MQRLPCGSLLSGDRSLGLAVHPLPQLLAFFEEAEKVESVYEERRDLLYGKV
jgi:hypothetical protein